MVLKHCEGPYMLYHVSQQCPQGCSRNGIDADLFQHRLFIPTEDRLTGLVVEASASRAEDPGFESRLRRDFFGSSHSSDFKIGTPVATLPGAWRHRVSAGTGWPGVSIL